VNMHKHAGEQLIRMFNQEVIDLRRRLESLEYMLQEVEHEIRREAKEAE